MIVQCWLSSQLTHACRIAMADLDQICAKHAALMSFGHGTVVLTIVISLPISQSNFIATNDNMCLSMFCIPQGLKVSAA